MSYYRRFLVLVGFGIICVGSVAWTAEISTHLIMLTTGKVLEGKILVWGDWVTVDAQIALYQYHIESIHAIMDRDGYHSLVVRDVLAREAPALDAPIVGRLAQWSPIQQIIQEQGDWVQVLFGADSQSGWIHNSVLTAQLKFAPLSEGARPDWPSRMQHQTERIRALGFEPPVPLQRDETPFHH